MTIESLRKYTDAWFVALYLMYGSVEEVIRSYDGMLPISVANYHRLVKKFGLVKSAGRHVSLPETLHFFREKAMDPDLPIEQIYRSMPPSFQTSIATLHRIYHSIEQRVIRRCAAALIIVDRLDPNVVLIGKEVFGNSRYGKKVGDLSIPMSFAKKDESDFDSALRVLQQEVFSREAISGNLKPDSELVTSMLSKDISPISYFDIVDVRVKVYQLVLPEVPFGFSSYKLIEHKMTNLYDLDGGACREGVTDMLNIHANLMYGSVSSEPQNYTSSINQILYRTI